MPPRVVHQRVTIYRFITRPVPREQNAENGAPNPDQVLVDNQDDEPDPAVQMSDVPNLENVLVATQNDDDQL